MDQQDEDGTVVGQIARALAQRIISGALAPDVRLRQDHLANEFRASHVPVREAFRRLEAQGLVVSEPRRGVRVAAFDPRSVREVTEMRAALEALALRHALPQMTVTALETAAAALREGEGSADIMIWEHANRRFHRAILLPCGMPRLLGAINDLHGAGTRFLLATWQSRDWRPRSDDEHRRILDAVITGECDIAVDLLSRHILAAGEALIETLEQVASHRS